MPLLSRNYVLLAKIESSYGVDANPTDIDAVLVENLEIRPVYDVIERDNVAVSGLSKIKHLIGRRHIEISFDVELRGAGTGDGDTPPDFAPLLKACKMAETIAGDPDYYVEYKPTSDADPSVTIYAYKDGIVHKAVGCVGSWSLEGEVGQPCRFRFTFQGKLAGIEDSSQPEPTFQNLVPPVLLGATFSYGTWQGVISRFSLNLNNTIAPRLDVTEESGIKGFWISDRKPEGSIDPEAVTISERNVWQNLQNVSEAQLQLVIGSDTANKCTITCPKCAKKEISWGDRDGIATYEISFGIYRDTGDDEITLKFD